MVCQRARRTLRLAEQIAPLHQYVGAALAPCQLHTKGRRDAYRASALGRIPPFLRQRPGHPSPIEEEEHKTQPHLLLVSDHHSESARTFQNGHGHLLSGESDILMLTDWQTLTQYGQIQHLACKVRSVAQRRTRFRFALNSEKGARRLTPAPLEGDDQIRILPLLPALGTPCSFVPRAQSADILGCKPAGAEWLRYWRRTARARVTTFRATLFSALSIPPGFCRALQ